jgi:glycosyltransferase involved in cell wall biosynthesis
MAPRLIERVAELGMGRKFHFTGFLSGQELEQIFLESDIYVMPSVSEPFGISPLEAMYFDVPVIISNQSGVAEVLTHALKFDFWDVNDLAGKILAMLDHSPLRQELMEQGARELEGFQWSKAASALENIYQTVQSVA